jgi:hypothetical protein
MALVDQMAVKLKLSRDALRKIFDDTNNLKVSICVFIRVITGDDSIGV